MNRENDNAFCIDGITVSFDSVMSDNLLSAAPLAGAAILDEKASFAIYSRKTKSEWNYSIRIPGQKDGPFSFERKVAFNSSAGLLGFAVNEDNLYSGALGPEVFHPAPFLQNKSNAAISLHDLFRATSNESAGLLEILGIKEAPYAAFQPNGKKRHERIVEDCSQFVCVSDAFMFQCNLKDWYLSGFPHRYYEQNASWKGIASIRPPKLTTMPDFFPMSFLFMESQTIAKMRVDKLVLVNPYGGPTKIYLPLTNWCGNSLQLETGTLLKLPFPDKQPLYNLPDIQKATSVVLCASLEDAESLKKANARQTDVAFTSFICDHECFDEVDLSPLGGKKLYMLISNQSGRSMPEEYLETNRLYSCIRTLFGDKHPITFIHREVEYPDIGIVDNVNVVFNAYRSHPPRVRKCELLSKQEFNRRIVAITAFMSQTWAFTEQEADKDFEVQDRTKQMLIRPFLHRGSITMIQGQAKTYKTTTAVGLSALIVSEKHGKTLIEGCAITVPRNAQPGKVVYLAFDSNCATRWTKLEADAVRTYKLNEIDRRNLIMLSMVSRAPSFKSDFHTIADEIRDAVAKKGSKERSLSLIVIDTLSPLGEPTSAIHAVEAFSAEFPHAAILCLSHDNAEGGPNGGGRSGGKIYGACTHVIKLEKTGNGVHFSFAASNDGILPFDLDGFTFRVVDNHGKMVIVDPVRSEDEARAAVKSQLMDSGYSAEDCAHQLGISASSLRAAVQRSCAKDRK